MKEMIINGKKIKTNLGGNYSIGNGNSTKTKDLKIKKSCFESDEEYNEYLKKDEISHYFITTCIFKNARVLDYDCYSDVRDENVLTTLNGRYAIYNNNGDMYLVKWGD